MNFVFDSRLSAGSPAVFFVSLDGDRLGSQGPSLPSETLTRAKEDGFSGKAGSVFVSRLQSSPLHGRALFVGLGTRADVDPHTFRLAGAAVARWCGDARASTVQVPWVSGIKDSLRALRAFAEGVILGSYQYEEYKSKKSPAGLSTVHFLLGELGNKGKEIVMAARTVAEAVNFSRDLINRPPSDKRPLLLAAVAKKLAGRGVSVKVMGKPQLERMGARALLGVNRGSAHPPVLVHLHYRPKKKAVSSVCFVGKGVTFDSGGLSLKPADGMMTMKYDMAGAAVVFSLFKALPILQLPVDVHGVAAITENMPGPDAYKPGDVLRALNGKTIEVLNTDAEGRVILADALSYAARLKCDAVIDVATLTGAASVALGKSYAALMSDHPDLEKALRNAANEAGEKMWPLPLEKTYVEHIQSKVADFKNIGNPGEAGTIVGGLFLKQFAGEGPWAHVDMASVGWNGQGSLLAPPGATGALVRTFLTYCQGLGGKK
ncbi:MAG: leucyl aminopeptidase [Elusimicrobia bacterium]|nr:leucyl aminopeptidase [Elusimicrobiota bacterium]